MGTTQARDWDALEAPEKPRKKPVEKNLYAALETQVREHVLRTEEDWVTAKHISMVLKAGATYVGQILKALAEEDILGPLQRVPMEDPEERIQVGTMDIRGGHANILAYAHDGQWVIGYYDRSSQDPKKTVLVHGRPDFHRWSRVRRRGTISNYPTEKHKARLAAGFKYEPAKWDGRAHFVLRRNQPFIDSCVAAGIEPNWTLPWDCAKCGRKGLEPRDSACLRCKTERPKLIQLTDPKLKKCPNCDELVSVSHARRHGRKQNQKEYYTCMKKLVALVHGM